MNKHLITLVCALFLTGCALWQPKLNESEVHYQSHRQAIIALDSWAFDGKMSIFDGKENTTFSLEWQQHADGQFQLYLSGPLGMGAVSIVGNQHYAELIHPDGNIKAKTASELVKRVTNLDLPIDSLIWWVRGIDNPKAMHQLQLDEKHLPMWIAQQGWQIEFDQYHQITPPLPYKIQFSQSPYSGKLVIRSWDI